MKTYIGFSTDINIRHQASSGGVGSGLVKYLLDTKEVRYALSFDYVSEHVCYQPRLVSSFSNYKVCGSIYQEMNLMRELKKLLNEQSGEKGKIVLFSLPCQTRALREICLKAGFTPIIIGLTCSSQQSHEATTYLLSRLGINEKEVEFIRYRGNGWPSGIQVKVNNGNEYFIKNNGSIWTEIFHSRVFIQPRCFSCRNTLNDFADIVLADPWLREYVETETEGKTLFAAYTELGENYIRDGINAGYINAEEVEGKLLIKSQENTIFRKEAYFRHPGIRNIIKKMSFNDGYRRLLLKYPLFFKLHCIVRVRLERLIIKKEY